jgi:hypothetical protein
MTDTVDLTEADKKAIESILASLEVGWWLEEKTREALTKAYTLGRQSKNEA